MNIELKISGSGSKQELTEALQLIINDLQNLTDDEVLDGGTWENETLITEYGEEVL